MRGRVAGIFGMAGLVFSLTAGPTLATAAGPDPSDARGPLDIAKVDLRQDVHDLVLEVRTRGDWGLPALTKYPRSPEARAQRFLCLVIRSPRVDPQQLCAGGKGGGLGRSVLEPAGARRQGAIRAKVTRPARNRLRARFRPAAAGLAPGRFRWWIGSGWSGPECQPEPVAERRRKRRDQHPDLCLDRSPNGDGSFRGRVFDVRPTGCTRRGRRVVLNGPRTRKAAALTFDDGPSGYTSRILSILDRRRAKGTFFAIGSQVPARAALLRSAVERGHEVANHSLRHGYYPSYGDLRATNAVIRRNTGFTPCSFRPPGRFYNSALVGNAARLGMTTVLWDVDPQDWRSPGTGAIYSRVVGATRPGSIVVMHDGGGNRAQTVAALPRIISTLRKRGYRLVTVHRLLGGRTIYEKVR